MSEEACPDSKSSAKGTRLSCGTKVKVVIRKKSTGGIRRRLLDQDGFIQRVAAVCINEEETQVLLITSKKDSTSWSVPGGGIEATEQESEAALREAWEEAGVRGHIKKKIGLFETVHPTGSKKHRTSAFVLVVTELEEDFPEAYLGRKRQWFSTEEAFVLLARHHPPQSLYFRDVLGREVDKTYGDLKIPRQQLQIADLLHQSSTTSTKDK